jgi:hypothetical protein
MIRMGTICALGAGSMVPRTTTGQEVSPDTAPHAATIEAFVVTGFNRYLGEPRFELAAPVGTFGFTTVGAYNPNGDAPLSLTAESPKSTVLATYVDPAFLAANGLTPADVDPAKLNVPLRQVAANVSGNGLTRAPLKGVLDAAQVEVSQAEPAEPITLGDWERGSGKIRITCHRGEVWVDVRVRHLIPNRLYTTWAIFGGSSIDVIPLGGAPNVIITDGNGDGRLRRQLNFCPLTRTGQRPLVDVEILLHGDQQNYGGVPELPAAGKAQSLYAGTVTFAHLDFPITLAD